MQIIAELAPSRRNPYGGANRYLDFCSHMDTCIALPTMVAAPSAAARGRTFDIQAGAGVVADSDPAAEYEETLNKARALPAAIAAAKGVCRSRR